jgi:hypothetical protein
VSDQVVAPEAPEFKRKMSVRRVVTALTIGKREEDKAARRTTAAGGSAALLMYALSVFQGEAKAWRELSVKQAEITASAVDRSTEAVTRMTEAVRGQTETFQSLNFTLSRIEGQMGSPVPPAPRAKVKAVKR